jgi:hypothetical protein
MMGPCVGLTPWDFLEFAPHLNPPPMESSSSAMDVSPDPVSLRAAALSTLKRRKPVPNKATTVPPSRSTHTSDFQLDYGQEDGMAVDSHPSSPPKSSPKSSHNAPIVTNDIQMREEGEISDEEDILRPKRSSPPPLRKSKSPIPVVEPKSSPHQKSPALEERAPLSLLERFSGYAPSNEGSETDIVIPDAQEPELDSSLSSLGPDRVRPGIFCRFLPSFPGHLLTCDF